MPSEVTLTSDLMESPLHSDDDSCNRGDGSVFCDALSPE